MRTIPTQLPIFIEVCKESSLSSAARKLGISTPAVSKAITKLEKEWKVKLFHRTPHSLSITDAGTALFEQLQPAVSSIHKAIDSVQQGEEELTGKLKISLPNNSLGVDTLLPHITTFAQKYSNTELDLKFSDSNIDLVSNGFDIGIGTFTNQDWRLITRQIFAGKTGLYASQSYTEKHGTPMHPDELTMHRSVPLKSVSTGEIRTISLYENGKEVLHTPKGNITVDSLLAAKDMLRAGMGIVGMAEWEVKNELEAGEIVPVLEDYWAPDVPVYIYFSSKDDLPKTVRAFIEHMCSVNF